MFMSFITVLLLLPLSRPCHISSKGQGKFYEILQLRIQNWRDGQLQEMSIQRCLITTSRDNWPIHFNFCTFCRVSNIFTIIISGRPFLNPFINLKLKRGRMGSSSSPCLPFVKRHLSLACRSVRCRPFHPFSFAHILSIPP